MVGTGMSGSIVTAVAPRHSVVALGLVAERRRRIQGAGLNGTARVSCFAPDTRRALGEFAAKRESRLSGLRLELAKGQTESLLCTPRGARNFTSPVVSMANESSSSLPLAGKVAIVTGGSRGVGRGIAFGLGEAGATVYVTGRSIREPTPEEAAVGGGGGNIVATADEVTRRGGKGIPVKCDHGNDDEVRELFKRVQEEQGALHILVNNALSLPDGLQGFTAPFWQAGTEIWDSQFRVGVRSTYVAAALAAPVMLRQCSGLIVNVSSFGGMGYAFNVPYGASKAAVDRMSVDMGYELKRFGVTCVALWPGIVRTERIEKSGLFSAAAEISETPVYSGRAVASLAADPNAIRFAGQRVVVAELAQVYGFKDSTGLQPPSLRNLKTLAILGSAQRKISMPQWLFSLVPSITLPWFLLLGNPSTKPNKEIPGLEPSSKSASPAAAPSTTASSKED